MTGDTERRSSNEQLLIRLELGTFKAGALSSRETRESSPTGVFSALESSGLGKV